MKKYKFLAIALLLSGSLGLGLAGCDREQTGDQSKAKGGSERAGKTEGGGMPSQGPGGPGGGTSSPGSPAGR